MLGRIGRYDIERLVGAGGMGVVLKGFDTELHRVVAIKVQLPQLATSAAARRRFAREAQAAAAVVHEHVIPIYNVETEGDLPYLVMQFVPGHSLQTRVDEHGPLAIKEVLRLARQAASGLAAAHAQGVVHRDVKPANILLEESVDRVLLRISAWPARWTTRRSRGRGRWPARRTTCRPNRPAGRTSARGPICSAWGA